MTISTSDMLAWYRNVGINISFYQDESTGLTDPEGAAIALPAIANQVLAKPTAGVIADLPTEMRSFLWIEGTWVMGTGPTMNFGQVRDSALIGTNDWIAFQAQFNRPCYMGPKDCVFIIDHDLCAQDKGLIGPTIACPTPA
jgi:hypothetical protein